MTRGKRSLLAAEYALGTLDGATRLRVARQIEADPELRALVANWEKRLTPLADEVEAVPPPPELWPEIQAAVRKEAPVGTITVRDGEGMWSPVLPGIEKKTLYLDEAGGFESYLLRLAPGAEIPRHEHTVLEECLVLVGEMSLGDMRFFAGDYHVAPKGVPHAALRSDTGALLYLRGELRTAG